MKLRHKASGEIWEVEHFVARSLPIGRRTICDLVGYELIPDEPIPQQSPHVEDLIASNTRAIGSNAASISSLASIVEGILKRIQSLESDNQRLKDRLNAIEGVGIPP